MKKLLSAILAVTMFASLLVSCNTEDSEQPIELPASVDLRDYNGKKLCYTCETTTFW